MDKNSPDGISPENNAMQAALNRIPKRRIQPDVLARQRVASGQIGKILRNSGK